MVSSQSSSTHGGSLSKARLDGIGNVVAYPSESIRHFTGAKNNYDGHLSD